jgi:succinyl-diaminopimelate desuccinylase
VIPGSLELLFNFRHSTASTPQSLQQRLAAILDKHALPCELAWTGISNPYLTPRGRLVDIAAEAIRDVTGVTAELSCTGGTSDGRFISTVCDQVVEIGPVNASIHKIDERIRIADLEPLSAIYRAILERLLP